MSTRFLALIVAAAFLGRPASAEDVDRELQKGMRLVAEGENAQAIMVLDAAARRLSGKSKKQAAQAYLNLGVAYVGEDQQNLARSSFRQALAHDPELTLSAFDVSPKVRELFATVVNERATAGGKKGGGGGKVALIGLGVAAVAGGGIAVATGGGGGSAPSVTCDPSVHISNPSIAPGTTLSLRAATSLRLTVAVPAPSGNCANSATLTAILDSDGRSCYSATAAPVNLPASSCTPGAAELSYVIDASAVQRGCSPPFRIRSVRYSTIYTSSCGGGGASGTAVEQLDYPVVE